MNRRIVDVLDNLVRKAFALDLLVEGHQQFPARVKRFRMVPCSSITHATPSSVKATSTSSIGASAMIVASVGSVTKTSPNRYLIRFACRLRLSHVRLPTIPLYR